MVGFAALTTTLRNTLGVSPQATLRGLAAMLCGLRYDEHNRLLPLDPATPAHCPPRWAREAVVPAFTGATVRALAESSCNERATMFQRSESSLHRRDHGRRRESHHSPSLPQ